MSSKEQIYIDYLKQYGKDDSRTKQARVDFENESEKPYWRGKYFSGSRLDKIFDFLRTLEYAGGGSLARTYEAGEIARTAKAQGREMTEEEEKEFFRLTESSISLGSMKYGIKHRISPSAVFDIKNPIASILFDISQDPTSYISGGTSEATKITGRISAKVAAELGIKTTSKVAIRKEGVVVLRRMIESGRYSYDEASELLLEWMAKHPADAARWIHPGGLRFAGMTIVPGKYFERGWEAVTGLRYVGRPIGEVGAVTARGYEYVSGLPSRGLRWAGGKTWGATTTAGRAVQKQVTRGVDWFGEAFEVGRKIKTELPEGIGGQYVREYLDYVLEKRGAVAQAFHELKVTAKPFKKRGREITKYIEATNEIMEGITPDTFLKGAKLGELGAPRTTGNEALDKFIESVVKPRLAAIRKTELAHGIDVGELSAYVPHVLTKKGGKFVQQMGGMPEVWRYYAQKVRAPYAKERTIEGTIKDINKVFGFEFFEPDFWKALAKRTQKHVVDIKTSDWIEHVKKEYGIEAPITDVEKIFKGYKPTTTREMFAYTGIDEFIEKAFKKVPSPFEWKEVERTIPYKELLKTVDKLRESLTPEHIEREMPEFKGIREFIKSEKTGLLKGTYKAAMRKIKELDELTSTYREIYGDVSKREEWVGTHRGVLHGMRIAPGEPKAIERFVSQEIDRIAHEITQLPSTTTAGMERVRKKMELLPAKELRKIEDKFIEELDKPIPFGVGNVKRAGEPIYEEIVTRATTIAEGSIEYIRSRHPQIDLKTLLPKPIAKQLEEMVEPRAEGPIADALRGYDWLMTYFKRAVTIGFGPLIHTRFFARNVYSGIWQNIQAGLYSPYGYARGVQARLGWETPEWMSRLGVWPAKFKTLEHGDVGAKEMQDIMRRNVVIGQPGMTDIDLARIWQPNMWERIRELPGQIMAASEDVLRTPLFTKYIEKMSDKQARDIVGETHFWYLPEFHTPFERGVAKRIFPFWTWLSRNVPFTIKRTLEQPLKLATAGRARDKLYDFLGLRVAEEGEVPYPPEQLPTNLPPGWKQPSEGAQFEEAGLIDPMANLTDTSRYAPIAYSTDGNVTQVYDLEKKRPIYLTEWQRKTYTIPAGKGIVGLDLPFVDLTTGISDLYFGISPIIKVPLDVGRVQQGYGTPEYKREKTWDILETAIGGRYYTTMKGYQKRETPLEKALYLAGLSMYKFPEEPTKEIFKAAQWEEPHPTKEQRMAAWIAAGMPIGFKIRTFATTAGGPRGVQEEEKLSTWQWLTQKAQFWKEFPKEEEPTGEFALLALREDVYERARQFKPTPEQLQYIFTTVGPEPVGAKERRFEELLTEWEDFKSGELKAEYPTEEQRMESWRRAGKPSGYIQKIYRDELGKLLGVSTFTPEEIEAMGTFQPNEAQRVWAFRKTRKMLPKKQMKIWSEEFEDKRKLEEDRREELGELRTDIRGTTKIHKNDPYVSDLLMITRGGEMIGDRMTRKRELEDLLGVGVDR